MAGAMLSATDADGRVIGLRKLAALDRLRLFKALGPALVDNAAYFGVAFLAASVCELDGVPVPFPANEAQLEGIVARLGDVGLDAVSARLETELAPPMSET